MEILGSKSKRLEIVSVYFYLFLLYFYCKFIAILLQYK